MQLSSEDPEENLTAFRNAFHFSAVDTLGQKSCKHQDYFDENGEENTTYTRQHQDESSSVSNMTDYNNISMTMADLRTCWIPG